jgi:hypothetical protein
MYIPLPYSARPAIPLVLLAGGVNSFENSLIPVT